MRFSMFCIFGVLGMVGLSGAALAERYPGGEINPYPYARNITVAANYATGGWKCGTVPDMPATGSTTLLKVGENTATCQWFCPDGYCWSFGNDCSTNQDEREQYVTRQIVIDPAKAGTCQNNNTGYQSDMSEICYISGDYRGMVDPVLKTRNNTNFNCIPAYAWDYYYCNYDDAKPTVKASELTVKNSTQGTCKFTCADGYKKDGQSTFTVTELADSGGKRVVIKATACTGNTIGVDYDENGAAGTSSSTCTYGAKFSLPSISRTGYTFGGWKLADGTTVAAGTSVDCNYTKLGVYEATSTGKVVAQWTPIEYTVEYNGNGATSGTMTASIYKYGDEKALTANAFKRTGYTFVNWNTQADGKGTKYTDKQVVSNLKSVNGAKVTLYAQWGGQTYTVTYDCDDGYYGATGTSSTGTDTAIYGQSYEIPIGAYCRHSTKPFGGWNFPSN